MSAELLTGHVMHRRLRPVAHHFAYRVFFLRLPLTRLEDAGIAVNRPGLCSFHYRDHGARDGSHPLAWIRQLLAREGIEADGEVWLHCFPRVLGYVFNPVSFWFCEDRNGRLQAVLAEVNNTFGEHHSYLLAHPDRRPIETGDALSARKAFHVSPFCEVEGGYAFQFRVGAQDAGEGLAVAHLEVGACVALAEGAPLAARQRDFQAAALQPLERAQDQGGAHRESASAGGTGLRKNGTRFSHRRRACQWMRPMIAKVMSGWVRKAAPSRARVSGCGRPEMLV